jgi:hypothetical protein
MYNLHLKSICSIFPILHLIKKKKREKITFLDIYKKTKKKRIKLQLFSSLFSFFIFKNHKK